MYKVSEELLQDIKKSLNKFINYNEIEEKRHYEEMDEPSVHIYLEILKSKKLVKLLKDEYYIE